MNIIASSPRSGSTYFRFILCNLLYEGTHDFDSVNRLIPTIQSEIEMRSAKVPIFVKTHEKYNYASCFLHRHVEDKLVSEYFYQKHFYGETKSIEDWIQANDYGVQWRELANFYIGCYSIRYDDLINDTEETVMAYLSRTGVVIKNPDLPNAIWKSRKSETSKLLPHFSRTDNYQLPDDLKNKIREANWRGLKLLGYDV